MPPSNNNLSKIKEELEKEGPIVYDVTTKTCDDDNSGTDQSILLNIITEKTTEIEELTVNQAIMKMDLAGLPALVFVNVNNKRINVVYHRKDGNISWIDPNYK